MQFKRLADLIIEAKGEKPGARYYGAQNAEGPAGMSSTPVGRNDYNPEDLVPRKGPVDTKAKAVRDTEKVLRNCFRVIKGSQKFRDKLNAMLTTFTKKRKQIREDQERVITDYPGEIDRLFGQITRYEKIIRALEEAGEGTRVKEFQSKMNEDQRKMDEYSEELEAVREQALNIIGENEDTSTTYQEAVIELVQDIAEEEYDHLLAVMSDREKAEIQLKSLDDIEPEMLDDEQLDRDEQRLTLLNMLTKDTADENPLIKFFYLAEKKYEETKASDKQFAGVARRTQNVTVEMLYNRLPMNNFIYFYNASKDDLPVRKITVRRRKAMKVTSPIMSLLDKIDSEEEYNKKKYEIKDLIGELDVDAGRMSALMSLLDGPYKKRGTTTVQRLRGMLKSILRESIEPGVTMDTLYLEVLSRYDAD
jgi:uncharacterized protein YukE